MKTRFWKSAIVLILICALGFSLTGCDNLDYREAIELYNKGSYQEAEQIFSELGDYEDSASLKVRCKYWLAIKAMEFGRYDAALEQFLALGEYEDAPARVTECKYQLALAAFENSDWDTAEEFFLQTLQYKQTAEYCRQINWQRLFDAIAENAPGEAESALTFEQDGYTVQVIAQNADQQALIFSFRAVKDMGYVFTDSLQLRITRDSLQASFAAESGFTMNFKGSQIGSQQAGSGTLDIPTCTAQTPLVLTNFSLSVTDNLGKDTASSDPADSLMNEAMAENFAILLETVPGMLAESGIPQTLADIGFTSLG